MNINQTKLVKIPFIDIKNDVIQLNFSRPVLIKY